jgi:hypothetical protein
MALLNPGVFKPIAILPSISFLGLIIFCFLNIKFDVSLRKKSAAFN